MVEEREIWRNLNLGDVWIDLNDPYTPNMRVSHRIGPGDQVSITTEERRFNQSRVPKKEQDLFTNGTLTPVQLVDSAADFEEIALSPNVKSETDLREMFGLPITKFKKELAEIDNVRLLERLAELSGDEDINASVPQNRAIEARLADVRPDTDAERRLGDQTEGTPLKPTKLSKL